MGRVLDHFKQPVSGATVRVLGSNLRTATDATGNYRLPYVPGKFRVAIEKDAHDSEEIDLDLAQATTYPLEDKSLTPVPQSAGLYFQGKRAWLPTSACRIEQAERDTALSGTWGHWDERETLFAVRGEPSLIVHDGTPYFLDLTGVEAGCSVARSGGWHDFTNCPRRE